MVWPIGEFATKGLQMTKQRRPALTAEFVRSILDYDPLTGTLKWRYRPERPKRWNTRYAGTIAGSGVKGYIQIQIEKVNYYAHQLAWCHYYGVWPPDQIDHRYGVRHDNRIEELRLANNSQNGCNKKMQRNNQSGFVGVHFVEQCQKWEACIVKDKTRVWRKFFDTAEEAAAARRQHLAQVHGEFARH